ncbi:MAG: DNA-directed RNA polymerase subunit beta', partial [Acidimicrobiales bacterium]
PLVCGAFNADFDGDQMAVHLPLSAEAQAEARVLMLSANNVLSPAHGRPLVTPTQDMVIGSFYLTEMVDDDPGGGVFRRVDEVERAYESGAIGLHGPIEFRHPDLLETPANGQAAVYTRTTAGRVLFNQALPEDFPYINEVVRKRDIGLIVDQLATGYPKAEVAASLDRIKALAFQFAARSGLTVSIDDVSTPPEKQAILDRHEEEAEKIEGQFRRGIITDGERRQKEVEIWTAATDEVRRAMEVNLRARQFNPIDMMVGSGARGNMMQVRQIAGMRGLVANPRGDMIPRPIKSNFREGLTMLEYFIATPGARKGLVDTALRTADSGYLTRRLVDVAQEVIINDRDPFGEGRPVRGLFLDDVKPDGYYNRVTGEPASPGDPDAVMVRTYLETRLYSRVLADDVTLSDGTVLPRGTMVREAEMNALRDDPGVARVRVLSPLTDDSPVGITGASYGMSLATGIDIEVGEAVGVIAAQSIGEPGTQLTMRTFHTGGVAGGADIAGGLPRVVELFEARSPKGKATLARISGTVRIVEDEGKGKAVTIVGDDGSEDDYIVPLAARLEVVDGQEITAGDPIVDGPRDPKELLEIRGIRETQQYLVEEVQKVYRDQGVSIHDKHIELIVRQMTRRVAIQEPGDSDFLPGERCDQWQFADVNRRLVTEGKRPAEGRPEIMGITKASLATDSWLSAASFQETTRVLTEAAIEGRSDSMIGLKENIIIGKLIPAGTGLMRHRELSTSAPDYQPMAFYSREGEEQDPARWLASIGAEQAGNGADVTPIAAGSSDEIG